MGEISQINLALETLEDIIKGEVETSKEVILDVSMLGFIARHPEVQLNPDMTYYLLKVLLELLEKATTDVEKGEKYAEVALRLFSRWGWRLNVQELRNLRSTLKEYYASIKPVTSETLPRNYQDLYEYCKEHFPDYRSRYTIRFSPEVNILAEIIGIITALAAAGIPVIMTNSTYLRLLLKNKIADVAVYFSNKPKPMKGNNLIDAKNAFLTESLGEIVI